MKQFFLKIFTTQWCNFHAKSDVPRKKKKKIVASLEGFFRYFVKFSQMLKGSIVCNVKCAQSISFYLNLNHSLR